MQYDQVQCVRLQWYRKLRADLYNHPAVVARQPYKPTAIGYVRLEIEHCWTVSSVQVSASSGVRSLIDRCRCADLIVPSLPCVLQPTPPPVITACAQLIPPPEITGYYCVPCADFVINRQLIVVIWRLIIFLGYGVV